MKILVAGASGLVGSYLYNTFSADEGFTVTGTFYSLSTPRLIRFDMRDKEQAKSLFNNVQPDVVLHAAANPNVEYCETNPAETRAVNVEGTKNLINCAKQAGSKFVFFSSEYVFDGVAGPYDEEAAPNPISEYGKQKLETENMIKSALDNFLIIRTTTLYGWEAQGKNFVMSFTRRLNAGQTVKVPADQISNPTYAKNLAEAVKELVTKNRTGVYNIVGSDRIDRHAFAKIICEVFGLNAGLLVPVPTAELGQKAKRPLNAGLKTEKAGRELKTRLMGAWEGLTAMKTERKQ